jgi:hypothetical protein
MHRFPDHTGPLFSKGDLYNVIAQHEASAKAMVADHDTDDFLSKTTQELIDIFMSHTRLVVPTLHRDREFLSPVQESHGEVRDYGRTVKLTGAIYQLNIPFTGDPEIFYHRPSRYSSSPPRAVVFQGQLRLGHLTLTDVLLSSSRVPAIEQLDHTSELLITGSHLLWKRFFSTQASPSLLPRKGCPQPK